MNQKNKDDYTPLVSVITTILNGAKYLDDSIQSVLKQSYPRIEHIFADGGSTDNTLEILKKYHSEYPDRVRFISEPDKMVGEAWNRGLAMAKGEILGWLGADDIYTPDAIGKVVEFFQDKPDAFFVSGACDVIDEKGNFVRKLKSKDFDLYEAINDACYISTPAAFYRKELVDRVGLFDTTLHSCDLDYWIRAGKLFKMPRTEALLAQFRAHKESVTGVKGADKMNALEGRIIMKRYGGKLFSPRMASYLVFSTPLTAWMAPFLKPCWHAARKLTGK
jgi:glycosyltransferase involved in cell wall biosynthesis